MGGTAGREAGAADCVYAEQLERWQAEQVVWAWRSRWLSNARLVLFVVALAVAWLTLGTRSLAPFWLAPPLSTFVGLIVVHDRVLRRRDAAERRIAHYQRGRARLDGSWPGGGASGECYRDPAHLYAEDLDLFGKGSLFEYVSTARTRVGEDVLARWLLEPAEPDEIRARQASVQALAPAEGLRARLATAGFDADADGLAEPLRRWGEVPTPPTPVALRIAGAALPAVSALAFCAWWWGGAVPFWLEGSLLLQAGFALACRPRLRAALGGSDVAGRDLALFAELLACIEREPAEVGRLAAIQARLRSTGASPSREIDRLRRLVGLLDARRNQLFLPISALLMWGTQVGFALEDWRARCGPAIGGWIDALGEFEALCALAGLAYEQPDFVFPELDDIGPVLEAEGLGHPLLRREQCVCNDVGLGTERRVLVVSGSNMSGKSTLLRAIGANTVLALAGGPVRATRMRLSRLALAASIQVRDSLLEGRSRFYTEIQRLREIIGLADGERPVLYLLDEILHGTNSHDRGIGAAAIVKGLVERGAIGLVTTHDLALAAVADELDERGANVHFEDHVEDGKIAFDYRMRPGVVDKSNALELMRAVGIEV